jgi:hypothetical protein
VSETPQETDAQREARQDAALADLEGQAQPGEPTPPVAPDAPTTDADGDVVTKFVVDGTFDAEDQHDAYKLLQAHFLELSRTGNGTLTGVSVAKA